MNVHMYKVHRKELEEYTLNCLQHLPLGSKRNIGSGLGMATANCRKIIHHCYHLNV